MTEGRTVFVADVHLGLDGGPRHRLFISFLRNVARRAETLCLLGDIFDLWVKPSHPQFPALEPVLDALSELAEAGVAIHFFDGNRDYFGAPYLAQHVGATTHSRAERLELGGRRVLVSHGDALCSLDRNYHIVRALTRNRLIHFIFAGLPAKTNFYLAHGYKRYSGRARARKKTRVMDLSATALMRGFREGAQDIVCGHVHRSCRLVPRDSDSVGHDLGAVYVVGTWDDESGWYLTLERGRFAFHRFPPPR